MMNFGILSLLPLLILILIALFIFRQKNPRSTSSIFQVNKRMHYMIVVLYVTLLGVAVIFAELMEPKKSIALELEPATIESELDIYTALTTGATIKPYRVLVNRTHEISDRLSIKNYGYGFTIYIKRKDVNDGVVEEKIYSPLFQVNDYNFTKFIKMIEPTWKNNEITMVEQPFPVIAHVFYNDGSLVNQFSPTDDDNFMSYSATSSSPIVYLLVPKDLVIDAINEEYIEYID